MKGLLRVLSIVAAVPLALVPATVRALDIGDQAPDFTLPSTDGKKISLSDFAGKKAVLIEFYGADFAPT